ncbi:MAG: magnesium transporter [Anaerolineales bacterium]|nr:magnesium transporter [Anaerolineales bacterium]
MRAQLAASNPDALRPLLNGAHPADIAEMMDRLGHADRHQVFSLLPPALGAKVLDEMSIEPTRQVLDQLSDADAARLLELLPMDEVGEIVTEDVPHRRQALLALLSPGKAQAVNALLAYPPKSAGRMMTEKFATANPEMTVTETLAHLRQVHPDVETLTDIYVVNHEEQLVGVVSLREVVVAAPDQPLAALMNTHLVTVAPETGREEVARLVSHYDYLALPVVTPDRRVLGIVPVDDVIDTLVAEGTEDILRFGGMEGGPAIDQPYFTVPVPLVIRKRVGWLLLLFLAETLTGTVLRSFEGELAKVVALSFFIPLLIGTGGNTGAQTVSTLIRGLALGEIQMRDIWRVIQRELLSGLLLGLLLGAVAFVRSLMWGTTTELALVVALSILAICTWANTIGALIPLIAHRFKIDPAVVSAPLITTLVDATGLAIYLLIAKLILHI